MSVQREHAFHGIVDRFIDRVVLPPFWTTGINHENQATDNARARARGRGVRAGVPDIYVCQAPARSCWIELKWGDNQLSEAQLVVCKSLDECEINVACSRSIHDVFVALKHFGFALHANAKNLVVEYQARAEAAVARAEAKASKRTSKPRAARASASDIKRAHKLGLWKP